MRARHKHNYYIRAFADGWALMQYIHAKKAWYPIDYPNFHPDAEYRVVPDEDGWLPWYGGKCPVAAMTVVEVRYKSGPSIGVAEAHFIRWEYGDVIAYRIIKEAEADPYAELKAAVKDPTKEVRCLHEDSNKEWLCNRPEYFAWSHPPEYYEIRDKPKKIKLLAYYHPFQGELTWRHESSDVLRHAHWKRIPSEDKEIEVE